ncbi:MAG: class I SAM-dependent methyltransferase [Thiobacillus sp.]
MAGNEGAPQINTERPGACPLCHGTRFGTLGEKNGFVVVSCCDCGLRFVQGMPSSNELDAFYRQYYANEKNERNAIRKVRRWWRKLLPLKLLAWKGLFLDLGCNTGFAVEAARRLGFKATGYDLSEQAIELARSTYGNCDFNYGTARDAVSKGVRYDAVLCAEMIEHLTELDTLADALSFLVKPGGILYLTTPDAGRYRNPQELLAWKEVCPPEHLIYFGREQISRFLRNAGFSVLFFLPVLHKSSIRVLARRMPEAAALSVEQ